MNSVDSGMRNRSAGTAEIEALINQSARYQLEMETSRWMKCGSSSSSELLRAGTFRTAFRSSGPSPSARRRRRRSL